MAWLGEWGQAMRSSCMRMARLESSQHDPCGDGLVAVLLLFGIVLLPSLLRVRLVYTGCWLLFTLVGHAVLSSAALGIATTMGITIMVGWYTLRIFDRSAFHALLTGWFGMWATNPMLGVAARIVDCFVHFVVPLTLVSCYLHLVRVWMSIPALVSSRLWCAVVVGGGVFPRADHVYRFSPPRSKNFWNAAYRMELFLNVFVPAFCVLAQHRSFWVYFITVVIGGGLFMLHLIRSLLLPRLRGNAKQIMRRLISYGELRPSVDFTVHNDSLWLDWMAEGLVGIGESYVAGFWETNSTKTLDEIVTTLMTLPFEGRQEMYRSWNARIVALATRVFQYSSSSKCMIVGAAAEQFDCGADFRHGYMDRYLHDGFGIWQESNQSFEDALALKHSTIFDRLQLQMGHQVLDLSLGSWGGVACYLAEHHPQIKVIGVVDSYQELAHAQQLSRELSLGHRVDFIVAETPTKVFEVLCSFGRSRFDRIVGSNFIERFAPSQRNRVFRQLKRIIDSGAIHSGSSVGIASATEPVPRASRGRLVLDVICCSHARSSIHHWNNKYIHGLFPCFPLTFREMQSLFVTNGFRIDQIASYSDHFERTLLEWNQRFQAKWDGQDASLSLPESFQRTWEFYLLHSAACFRSRSLDAYQVQLT